MVVVRLIRTEKLRFGSIMIFYNMELCWVNGHWSAMLLLIPFTPSGKLIYDKIVWGHLLADASSFSSTTYSVRDTGFRPLLIRRFTQGRSTAADSLSNRRMNIISSLNQIFLTQFVLINEWLLYTLYGVANKQVVSPIVYNPTCRQSLDDTDPKIQSHTDPRRYCSYTLLLFLASCRHTSLMPKSGQYVLSSEPSSQ